MHCCHSAGWALKSRCVSVCARARCAAGDPAGAAAPGRSRAGRAGRAPAGGRPGRRGSREKPQQRHTRSRNCCRPHAPADCAPGWLDRRAARSAPAAAAAAAPLPPCPVAPCIAGSSRPPRRPCAKASHAALLTLSTKSNSPSRAAPWAWAMGLSMHRLHPSCQSSRRWRRMMTPHGGAPRRPVVATTGVPTWWPASPPRHSAQERACIHSPVLLAPRGARPCTMSSGRSTPCRSGIA